MSINCEELFCKLVKSYEAKQESEILEDSLTTIQGEEFQNDRENVT